MTKTMVNNFPIRSRRQKVDVERPIIPNILPSTPWDFENEWVVSDQWPPVDEASISSAASTNLDVAPVIPQSGTHIDQWYMVGAGKKDKVEFKEGECRRIFKGAVYCRSFLPTKKANDLSFHPGFNQTDLGG